MRGIVRRLTTRGALPVQIGQSELQRANQLLTDYGIELEPAWQPNPPDINIRPVELLGAIGNATIGSLEPRMATLERRVALHWGIVKYVADLDGTGGRIRISVDGQRYKEVARGAFSGDLGVAWSALAMQGNLRSRCLYLDIDHAGAEYVRQGPAIRSIRSRVCGHRRPDFVAVEAGDPSRIDLVEAKGRKGRPDGTTLANAALQLFGVEAANGRNIDSRIVTSIHGARDLHVAAYRAREPTGFDPLPGPLGGDDGEPQGPPESPQADDGLAGADQRTANEKLVDGLLWLAARSVSSRDSEDASFAPSRWTWAGHQFEGLATTTSLGAQELDVREGVASDVLDSLLEVSEPLLRSREVGSRFLQQIEPTFESPTDNSELERVGGVFVSEDRVVTIGDYGSVLDIESRLIT